jgi:hypothetical protein
VNVESCHIDDEHRLIARYAARLAADGYNVVSNKQTKKAD